MAHGRTHVAIEARGVYWKPVWHVLEESFMLVLANAMHINNMPGRQSDMNDATWIADLLAHGLTRSSFGPPAPIRELRDLTRTRRQLVHEIVRHVLRIQKTLEVAKLKLTQVMGSIVGVSGRAILSALVAGETDLDSSRPPFQGVDLGQVQLDHEPMMVGHAPVQRVAEVRTEGLQPPAGEIAQSNRSAHRRRAGAFRAAISLLTTIPGISETTARALVAEIGTDMSRFPSVGHLISWARFCPRLDESAGKTPLDPHPTERPLAQDPGQCCLGRDAQEGWVFAWVIRPHQQRAPGRRRSSPSPVPC